MPTIGRVASYWQTSLKKLSTVDLEEEGAERDDLANDLVTATKILGFYWDHLPSALTECPDMNVAKMLEGVHAVKGAPGQVQLIILRKLFSTLSLSHADLATKHMGLLVSMAADDNQGSLALNTLAKMLDIAGIYQETSHNYLLRSVVGCLPRLHKKKVKNVLTDCLVNAIKNKDELTNRARELTRTYYNKKEEKCSVTEEIVNALMEPGFSVDTFPDLAASGGAASAGSVSPLLLAVLGSPGLQKHQAYLSDLALALVYTEESGRPSSMASFIVSQKLKLDPEVQTVLDLLEADPETR